MSTVTLEKHYKPSSAEHSYRTLSEYGTVRRAIFLQAEPSITLEHIDRK